MAEGLDWCWRFVPELFEVDATLQATIDPRHRARPARFRGRISLGDRGRAGRGASSKRPPTSARSSAADAATTASISAICSR